MQGRAMPAEDPAGGFSDEELREAIELLSFASHSVESQPMDRRYFQQLPFCLGQTAGEDCDFLNKPAAKLGLLQVLL